MRRWPAHPQGKLTLALRIPVDDAQSTDTSWHCTGLPPEDAYRRAGSRLSDHLNKTQRETRTHVAVGGVAAWALASAEASATCSDKENRMMSVEVMVEGETRSGINLGPRHLAWPQPDMCGAPGSRDRKSVV